MRSGFDSAWHNNERANLLCSLFWLFQSTVGGHHCLCTYTGSARTTPRRPQGHSDLVNLNAISLECLKYLAWYKRLPSGIPFDPCERSMAVA